jgi:outer membrane receptor for ferrienterochelin and colicins
LVSARSIRIIDEKLKPEISWNMGGTYIFEINKRWSLMAEYFETRFQNQLITDTEHPDYIYFYNSEGKNRAGSALLELNFKYTKSTEIKLAYRLTDTWQTLGKPFSEKVYLPKMFVARDRILLNVAHALPYDKWKFDFTWQWNGRRRIMDPKENGLHDSYNAIKSIYAPDYSNINAQISRKFTYFEWYLGGENLNNFKQKDPIIGVNEPFSTRFDAGMVWGPITGTLIYSGFRYKLQ